MKKGVVVFAGLALLSLCCLPLVAQPSSRAVETKLMDDFDNKGTNEWDWAVHTSTYIEEGFPKTGYFDGQPNSLRFFNKEGDEPKVFGVRTSFHRKGENWFEVYPVKDGEAYEIPFVGTVTQVDFWVWGANYLYYMDILVRDADGRVHTLHAGNLLFDGWRNVVVTVPTSIRQEARVRTGQKNMSFVGFRIRTDPDEFVDDFLVFFDNLKFTTNALKSVFDGFELQDVDFGDDGKSTSEAK